MMTTIVYRNPRCPRSSYAGGIQTTRAKPRTRGLTAIPAGQTLKLAKQLRKACRAYLAAKDVKPFGYEAAQRHLDAIVDLCLPKGRLVFALKGDAMPVSWAANIRQAAYAASRDLPVPGRTRRVAEEGDLVIHFCADRGTKQQRFHRCSSTRRDGSETLHHAIEDLIEFTRDRFERM